MSENHVRRHLKLNKVLEAFVDILKYLYNLKYNERPDYSILKKRFAGILDYMGLK